MSSGYAARTSKSRMLYERAKRVLPAGVSYGIRFFEPYPFYTTRAQGSKLYDVDGNEYVDFWLGHTAHILGHGHPKVLDAVKNQIERGTHFGTAHEGEVLLAEQVAKMVRSAEMTRFANSGTEGNMYAARLARAYTKKRKIGKFEGGWHGGYDALHVGVKYPFNVPESAGLTEGALEDTVLLPYNDLDQVKDRLKDDFAAIIVEPVLGAGGGVPADKQFLQGLREFCTDKDGLLIFDEVITGFRLAPGGAQQYFCVEPDLTVFGKILGGGSPVGAFSGRTDLMQTVNSLTHKRPECSFHGGTFVANPVTMTAGLATLKLLEDGKIIQELNHSGDRIRQKLGELFAARGVPVRVMGAGSLFNVHFTDKPVRNASDVYTSDRSKLVEYNTSLIQEGVFFLPTHNGALSSAHSKEDISKLYSATEAYLDKP